MTESDHIHDENAGTEHADTEHADTEHAREESERVAREGQDVRERVSEAILNATKGEGLNLTSLRASAQSAMDGVMRGVKDVGQQHRQTVLGEAFAGMTDAMEKGVNATRLAVEEAQGRGESFAKEDLKQAENELESMTETVEGMARRAGKDVQEQSNDFMKHAERTLQSMRPSLESALQAIRKHPAQAAGDAAAIGADVTGRLAKAALGIAGGLADGLRGAVSAESKDTDKSQQRGGEHKGGAS
ncbi:MAG: DUF6781 family protein [Phycisphaeraceae bacterium]